MGLAQAQAKKPDRKLSQAFQKPNSNANVLRSHDALAGLRDFEEKKQMCADADRVGSSRKYEERNQPSRLLQERPGSSGPQNRLGNYNSGKGQPLQPLSDINSRQGRPAGSGGPSLGLPPIDQKHLRRGGEAIIHSSRPNYLNKENAYSLQKNGRSQSGARYEQEDHQSRRADKLPLAPNARQNCQLGKIGSYEELRSRGSSGHHRPPNGYVPRDAATPLPSVPQAGQQVQHSPAGGGYVHHARQNGYRYA